MITGQVTPDLEAVIPIAVLFGQELRAFNAVIDTGFSGYLTLPASTIEALKLPFLSSRVFALGDDRKASFNTFKATVAWGERLREIIVLASDASPLVGMALLKGYRVEIEVVDGGEVKIALAS